MTAPRPQPRLSSEPDDEMPLTFRRQREEQRVAQAKVAQAEAAAAAALERPPGDMGRARSMLDASFGQLMWFAVKFVLAAIPALILLGLILFAMGQVAQAYFPWLVKMRIMVTFPG
jgi:hypothetical protein